MLASLKSSCVLSKWVSLFRITVALPLSAGNIGIELSALRSRRAALYSLEMLFWGRLQSFKMCTCTQSNLSLIAVSEFYLHLLSVIYTSLSRGLFCTDGRRSKFSLCPSPFLMAGCPVLWSRPQHRPSAPYKVQSWNRDSELRQLEALTWDGIRASNAQLPSFSHLSDY